MKLYPSLISANLLNLETIINTLKTHCDGYHIDIMDGHFVPRITWGPCFSNAIAQATALPLHIHLMVTNPATVIEQLETRPFDCISFHAEACATPEQVIATIEAIEHKKTQIGLVINPHTQLQSITQYVEHLDELVIMSVHPGASGQPFIPEIMEKIEDAIMLKQSLKPSLKIIVDGGVNQENIKQLAAYGVDACGVAAAIFLSENPIQALEKLYEAATIK